MAITIFHPIYYRILSRKGIVWMTHNSKLTSDVKISLSDLDRYGLTKEKLLIELFRIEGGKSGYYIANLRDKLYYYCGSDMESVRDTFYKLGIGRREPDRRN